jgi:ABC-type amino acid transport substrate-binding protein
MTALVNSGIADIATTSFTVTKERSEVVAYTDTLVATKRTFAYY